MRAHYSSFLAVSFFTLFGSGGLALAQPTVSQQPLGPDGQLTVKSDKDLTAILAAAPAAKAN